HILSIVVWIFRLIYVAFILFFFFFQAEDGIRDRNVTGVQTCALPISPWTRLSRRWPAPTAASPPRTSAPRSATPTSPRRGRFPRSEERRVGKECRYRWTQCQ